MYDERSNVPPTPTPWAPPPRSEDAGPAAPYPGVESAAVPVAPAPFGSPAGPVPPATPPVGLPGEPLPSAGAGLPPAPTAPGAPGGRPPVVPPPPLAGGWTYGSPSGPPLLPSGAGIGGGTGATPPAGSTAKRRGAGFSLLAAAAVFVAGAGGVLVGKDLAGNDASTSTGTGMVATRTINTVPGPVAANASEPIAAVAKALSPAVVQIETQEGLGSGFIYDKSGLILTAAHVTGSATTVDVRFADGTRTTGKVLGSDDNTDVAVIKIAGNANLPVAALATGVDLQVGQTAVAIGSPFGLDQTVTAGIVSAIGRSTGTPGQRAIPAIQTDAPINSGNSGGALADRQGRVIGINDSIITGNAQSSGNVGVGFAIPIDIAKAMADRIVAGRSTAGGFLGVRSSDATGARPGATIVEVESGSPAARAGVSVDDVVVSVDGEQVSSAIDLVAAVTPREPGEKVTLVVVRAGKERTIQVTLGSAPSN